MGKSVSKEEYDVAGHKLKGCGVKTCPNAGAEPDAEGAEYCPNCKAARRVRRDFERSRK